MFKEYKGYIGEVVYDDVAEALHARVINSGPYPIANAGATPLLGMALLHSHSLYVEVEDRGRVAIERRG